MPILSEQTRSILLEFSARVKATQFAILNKPPDPSAIGTVRAWVRARYEQAWELAVEFSLLNPPKQPEGLQFDLPEALLAISECRRVHQGHIESLADLLLWANGILERGVSDVPGRPVITELPNDASDLRRIQNNIDDFIPIYRPPGLVSSPTSEEVKRRLNADLTNKLTEVAGQDSSSQTAAEKASPIAQAARTPEARNKWVYEQCCRGVPHKAIIASLKTKPLSWPKITSVQGIRRVALEYAKRHGLPDPPPRQEK